MNVVDRSKFEFLRSVFNDAQLGSDGCNATIVCPECLKRDGVRKKKLAIRLDNGKWHCWRCETRGRSIVSLLKRYATHEEFVEYARQFDEKIVRANDEKSTTETPTELTLPDGFTLLATHLGCTGQFRDYVRSALCYLKTRGLTRHDLWYFKFGITGHPRYVNRIIMPSFDIDGKLNYFVCRSWDARFSKRKYLNALVPKSTVVFNELNVDWSKQLTLVEGPFDLTKCNENATCLLGSSLGKESLLFQTIVKNSTPIILVLDKDAVRKMYDIARTLKKYDVDVSYVQLKDDRDPGDMSKDEFASMLLTAVKWDPLQSLKLKLD